MIALTKRKTLRVSDNARTPRGNGVAKKMIEFESANTVRKAYASSKNPLPRVYKPGILTNIETNNTIHHANDTRARKIPRSA